MLDLVAQLRKERERITHAIEDLQASQGMLDAVIAAGPADAALAEVDDRVTGVPCLGHVQPGVDLVSRLSILRVAGHEPCSSAATARMPVSRFLPTPLPVWVQYVFRGETDMYGRC
ncbi:hypothetical protein [Streptosporangium sandarakinum]|uniref:hypothetical protein n=2 Tax=Streptosporangiaceae TaxID=2004 RepID=UPI003793C2BF